MHSGGRDWQEYDENPTIHSEPRQLKYRADHNQEKEVLVTAVGILNATSLGPLSTVKTTFDRHDLPAILISPQRTLSRAAGRVRHGDIHAG